MADDLLLGGWAKVYFKTRKHPAEVRVQLSTYDTNRSRWAKDKPGMIVKVASSQALRLAFPNSLGGLHIADEMEHVIDAAATAKRQTRVEASDLTAFAFGNTDPEVIDAYDEPVTKGQLFDTHENGGE
jgi:hypothetical protein